MPDEMSINFESLLTNSFGLCLAHGRLKATITDENGQHLTVQFKCWKRGDRRRNIPVYEAERIYISVPNQSWYGDKIGSIELATGMFWVDGAADSYRVTQAKKILSAAQGKPVSDRIQHPGSCMICGKDLTDPVSIDRGIGPDCYQSATGSQHQEKVKQHNRTGRPAPTQAEPVIDPNPHIDVASDAKHFKVDFQSAFNRALLAELKDTTDWRGRTYDSYTKLWWVAQNGHNAKALLDLAAKHNLNVSAQAKKALSAHAKEQADKPEVSIGIDDADNLTVSFDFGPNFERIKNAVKAISTDRHFNGVEKYWEVKPTKQAALALYNICKEFRFEVSEEAANVLKPLREQAENEAKHAELRASLSKAEDADVELDGFGFEPYPFQRAGIMYGEYSHDRYMIADEQGLGKTVQALGRIAMKQTFPAVIVCPSAVKVKWARAAKKAMPWRTVEVLEGTKPSQVDADILVLNYDILSAWSGHIISMNPMALVLDESHYIKNRKAQRTIAAKAIANAIPTEGLVICLTGTPVLNRPIELVEQLDTMGRLDDFGGFTGFVSRYVGWDEVPAGPMRGKKIPAQNGAKNLTELNERLRSTCFVRRLKRDVLPELPEKQRDVVPVELDGDAYRKAFEEARRRVINGESSTHAEHLAEIQHLRRAAVEGKMKGVIEWITDFLESGEKLVVFARHRDVQQRIADEFPGSVRIAGSQDQSKKARQAAMDAFQEDPDVKLAVVSLDAGREGIDLYAASNLAFVELGWNPGIHDQAEDRIHRIGQDRGTMMYYLLAEDTIDEEMAALIERKRKIKDAVTEGQDIIDEPDHDMVGNLIKWLTQED